MDEGFPQEVSQQFSGSQDQHVETEIDAGSLQGAQNTIIEEVEAKLDESQADNGLHKVGISHYLSQYFPGACFLAVLTNEVGIAELVDFPARLL